MKVSELIAELQSYDPDFEVVTQVSRSKYSKLAGPHLVNLEALKGNDDGHYEWLEFIEDRPIMSNDTNYVCISHLEQSEWDDQGN